MKYLFILALTIIQLSAMSQDPMYKNTKAIKIQWVDNLPGDFSFAKKWEYPEGIEKNDYGQVSCYANCPEGSYDMIDSTGKIQKKFLKDYYKIIDTTHQFHSIKADAWCYEYDGTDFINCSEDWDTNEFGGFTIDNAATHCTLFFKSDKDKKYCYPVVVLNSINGGRTIFNCTSGTIKIDKKSWKKGKMKAIFDFNFKNTTDESKPIFWKGKILAKVESVGPGC